MRTNSRSYFLPVSLWLGGVAAFGIVATMNAVFAAKYGTSDFERNVITGPNAWRQKGQIKDPYQQEHDDWFAAIRNDTPYNEAFNGAYSTLTAILGRMSTYTGKEVTWEQALNSQEKLSPDGEWSMDMKLDIMPKLDPSLKPSVRLKPGQTGMGSPRGSIDKAAAFVS